MSISKSLLALAAGVALSAAPATAQGRWLASYPEVQDPVHLEMRSVLQQDGMLEEMAESMNQAFRLPRDVTFELAECGTPAATYDPGRSAVRICYELLTALSNHEDEKDSGEPASFENAFAFILMHQVGHAVIDVLQMDVGVPTEEAADQFVAVMVGLAPGELDHLVDGVALLHDLELDWETPDTGATVLDSRRSAKLTCLIYGGDPETHGSMVEAGRLTASRAKSCPGEYDDALAAWTALLEEHLMEG
jgi:hypothetical protein